MFSLKIPFGLQNNNLVTPSEVKRGLACNCICPGCNARLIANHPKSSKRVNYFSHYACKGCSTGYQTALHLAAIRVISENKWILVPDIYSELTLVDEDTLAEAKVERSIKGGIVILDSVEQEVHEYPNIVPDIVAMKGGDVLFIEVAVTSVIKESKLDKLKMLNFPVLEIYLKPNSDIPSLEEIKKLVLNTAGNRRWVVNPKLLQLNQLVEAEAKKILTAKKNEILEQRTKDDIQHEKYLKLSATEKILYELNLLKIDFKDISHVIGVKVNGSDDFGVSSSLWQLEIYKEFIHKKQGSFFSRRDNINHLVNKFVIDSKFDNLLEVAIYRYLEFLQETSLINRILSDKYAVEENIFKTDTQT